MPHIERLTQLARVVRAAPEERFHMRKFVEAAPCGTAYCAAGWAAQDPWFKANGFPKLASESWEPENFCVIWNVEVALAEYFALSKFDTETLFALNSGTGLDPHAISREEVFDNIERLIDGQQAEIYAALTEDDE